MTYKIIFSKYFSRIFYIFLILFYFLINKKVFAQEHTIIFHLYTNEEYNYQVNRPDNFMPQGEHRPTADGETFINTNTGEELRTYRAYGESKPDGMPYTDAEFRENVLKELKSAGKMIDGITTRENENFKITYTSPLNTKENSFIVSGFYANKKHKFLKNNAIFYYKYIKIKNFWFVCEFFYLKKNKKKYNLICETIFKTFMKI